MLYRMLESNGSVNVTEDKPFNPANELVVDTDTEEFSLTVNETEEIVLQFLASADGRGFSVAASLRERLGYDGKLFAVGQLIPDQLSLAFQCGFDAVIVDNTQWNHYGKNAWMNALNPHINRTYIRSHWQHLDSIWEHRTLTQES